MPNDDTDPEKRFWVITRAPAVDGYSVDDVDADGPFYKPDADHKAQAATSRLADDGMWAEVEENYRRQ